MSPLLRAAVLAFAAACGTESPVTAPAPLASVVPQPSADLTAPSRVLAAAAGAACGVEPVRPFAGASADVVQAPPGLMPASMAVFAGPAGNPANPLLSTTAFTLLDFYAFGGNAAGGGSSVFPTDVNAAGQIVGYVDQGGMYQAYSWRQPAGYTVIAPLAGDAMSLAMGTNDAGLVVGYSLSSPSAVRAFTWSGGAASQLGPAFTGSAITYAMAVGNSGHIVGYGRFAPGVDHAYRYLGGTFQDLGVPAGYTSSYATSVSNDGGSVAGYVRSASARRPALWRAGGWTVLPLPAGYDEGEATGVNSAGRVVGWMRVAGTTGEYRGFYFDGASMSVAATLGGTVSRLWAINDAGMATGYASLLGNLDTHAIRYTPATGTVDIGKQVGACSSYGYAITPDGDVAGNNIITNTYRESVWPIDPPQRFTLGDRVWSDADADGLQESGEPGINGATVKLYDAANVEIGSQTTAGDGGYSFGNLLQGTYRVCVAAGIPAGHAQTYDLDGIVATPNCATATVGPNRTDVDFGYAPPPRFSLGDRVWTDVDADGAQEPGEAGINGVTLTLYDAANAPLGTTSTAGDGQYAFSDLPAGSYKVCVTAGAPAGHTQTFDLTAPVTDGCATANLGPSRTDVDFGYAPPRYTLGDLVWNDVDGSGGAAQGAGEPGLGGVALSIAGPAGYTAMTTTAANGSYAFTNLLAGSYTVCVASSNTAAGGPLAGFTQTYDLDGIAAGSQHCATASVGPSRTDVDFSYTQPRLSLGDRVWIDTDGDGAQEPGEPGVTGVTVTVTDAANAVVGTATTAGDGLYSVGNLLAGTYKVCLTAGLPASHTQTYDLDGVATANCATVTLTASRTDVDFGYAPPRLSLGDRVWFDVDNDGVQDAAETGAVGVAVTIAGPGGFTGSTTTAANGIYGFSNLLAGSYTVCVAASNMATGGVLAGYGQTYDLDGVATANCAAVNLTASRTDVDFGYSKGSAPVPSITATTNGVCTTKPTLTFKVADVDGATGGPWAYVVAWGDGTTSTGSVATLDQATAVTKAAQYASGGPFTVTVTVTDKAGLTGTATAAAPLTYSCGTKPPEVKYVEADCKCGSLPYVTFKVYDADGASSGPWTYVVSWGDGTTSTGTVATAMTGVKVVKAKAYPTNKTYTVTVTVTDKGGKVGTVTDQLTNDCADANDLPTPKYVEVETKCGKSPVLTFKVYDADGSADDFTYTVNWGDGTTSTGAVSTTMTLVTVTKAAPYATNGTYNVVVTVKDKVGEVGTHTLAVKVSCTPTVNLPPEIKYLTVEAKCTKAATATFKVYDSDSDAPWTYTVNWGDGSTPTTGTVTKEMEYLTVAKPAAYATNKTYTVTVTVKDGKGATATESESVAYSCAPAAPPAPKLVILTPSLECKATAKIGASFTDSDATAKPWSYVVDWGDGTKETGKVYATGDLTDDETHAYASAGTYTVKFTVTNSDGRSATATGTITVKCGSTGGAVCTRTQGYWKNHESEWERPLSPTMAFMKPGSDSKTWREVFAMPTSGGNSYLQLAHQWMAATLNVANGVKPSDDVAKTLLAAGTWLFFKTEGDGGIPTIKDAQANAWAEYLDKFNNGQLGTPHCK